MPELDQTPEQQADALAGSGLRTVMNRALPKSARDLQKETAPIKLGADAEGDYSALNPGMRYIDPDNNVRTKPWTVTGEDDYDAVPEGAQYKDPEGNLRTKPAYEDVDFTTHTLYNMAANDKERRKIMERSYPKGEIRQEPGGDLFAIDEDGKRYKPRRVLGKTGSLQDIGPAIAGAAGPTAGAAFGEVTAGPLGAAGGAMVGQAFNDAMLQVAGVYDRSPGEELVGAGKAGLMGGAGSLVGRGLGAATGAAGGIEGLARGGLPKAANYFLGTDPEGLQTAVGLAERGVQVPPSGYAKEAPHVQNIVEVFDPAFRTQKPLLQSATEHYEREGSNILRDLGISDPGSLAKPESAVELRPTGEALLTKAREASSAADAELERRLAEARTTRVAPPDLAQAAEESRRAAQTLIDHGYRDIQNMADQAVQMSGARRNSGDLWEMIGTQIQTVRRAFQERASGMYRQADELAGTHLPNAEGLPQIANEFAEELPEEFERNQPGIVRQIRAMAGERDENGNWIREPIPPTFGQLRNLRSQIRSNADFYRLNSDIKNGTYKFFAARVNEVLHDEGAVPELRAATQQLDRADAFYRENVRIYEAQQIKAIMKGLESGEPADPQNLFKTVVKEGHSDLINRIREMVGPNLWAGVRAADIDEMFSASRTASPGVIDGREFGRQVVDRYKSGLLHAVHGAEVGSRLLQQAEAIGQLDGKIDIAVRPGDRLSEVVARARQAADAAKAQAKQDPLATLNRDLNRMRMDYRKAKSERMKSDPLGFLYDPKIGAVDAAERILNNEDLLLAAAARFGPDSAEFEMLKRAAAQRVLQGTMTPGKNLAKLSPDTQRILFPGTTLEQMRTLAKEMDFLMSSRAAQDTAKSMAAVSKVEHPWTSILGRGASFIPGPLRLDPVGRAILTKYYAMWQKLTSNPAFLRWLEKGLKGDDSARETARQAVQKMMGTGGAAGAATGEAAYQMEPAL
jgi:hypothetical protein